MKKLITGVVCLTGLLSLSVNAKELSPGFYGEIGTSFGGDEVATNNNGGLGGDDYNAGGGAILGLGATIVIRESIKGRGLAAYRYQGGDGSNSGFVLEGTVLYQFTDQISAGVGVHADFNNEVETATGSTIEFENAVGPMAVIDWQFDPRLALGAKYIAMDYETEDGFEYDGKQGTVYVRMNF